MVERFFVIKKPNKQIKNFEEVVTKFALDEPSLQAKSKGLLRLSYTILAVTGFIFLYCIYQAVYGSWIGVMVAAVQVGIAAVLTFRYHFWAFQIQQRKLGCSFKDWLKNTFAGDHK
jgi:intracellular multiplication protein IcmV